MFWKPKPKPDVASLDLLAFLEHLPELAMVLEDGSTLTYLNASLRALWPSGVQLLGSSYWEAFPELSEGDPGRQCRAAMKDGQPRAFTALCLRSRKHYATRAVPVGEFLVLLASELGDDRVLPTLSA